MYVWVSNFYVYDRSVCWATTMACARHTIKHRLEAAHDLCVEPRLGTKLLKKNKNKIKFKLLQCEFYCWNGRKLKYYVIHPLHKRTHTVTQPREREKKRCLFLVLVKHLSRSRWCLDILCNKKYCISLDHLSRLLLAGSCIHTHTIRNIRRRRMLYEKKGCWKDVFKNNMKRECSWKDICGGDLWCIQCYN